MVRNIQTLIHLVWLLSKVWISVPNNTNSITNPLQTPRRAFFLCSCWCSVCPRLASLSLKLNRRSRWVNVPTSPQPLADKTGLSNSESSSSLVTNTGSVSSDNSSTTTIANEISETIEKKSISVSSDTDSSEKLTVTREEMVKGVVIKGIVCNPKNSQKSKSSVSLNPFEKRLAPRPPAPAQSDSVPKTKSKTRGGSRNWMVLNIKCLDMLSNFSIFISNSRHCLGSL